MSEHRAVIDWRRGTPDFNYDTFSRDHTVSYSDAVKINASSAAEYLGTAEFADPEQQLVGAISSCHMLTFLALACKWKFVVDAYTDDAVGVIGKNEDGRMAVTEVRLNPQVNFAPGAEPDAVQLAKLHEKAHKYCFIANSVRAKITVAD